ncbi:MAG: hypothetical protein CMN76_13125 [Spirochaetaceae bacterium]|nr:hypothetical protein [Spirochaetaceae bacterium]|tara:strand:- start:36034 stop:36726 length:693 start_codon:yes stop_codon:yes gene_type:complete
MNSSDQRIEKAKSLIKERELDPENLDRAESLLIELLEGLGSAPGESAVISGLLSQVQYWKGEVADSGLLEIYEKGVDYGKKGCELDASCIEAQFWLAVNYGFLGETRGILTSLFLIDPIEKALSKSLELDESYFYGGPHRAMGWFLHKVPPWPISKGDSRKGLKHLEKALEYGPDFYLNHIYIAQVFAALRDKENARKHLEWILEAPLSPKHGREDQRYKEQAKGLIERI